MKCSLNRLSFDFKLFSMWFFVIISVANFGVLLANQFKKPKNILADFDYLVSQLYVQHCTFVEIGEGICTLFIELPLESSSCQKQRARLQMFFGNCLCSEFRSWTLCSRPLVLQRPKDCHFEEGGASPQTSARVHRRLCDVTGMSQWNPQCNCSVTLAGTPQDPMCGFRTCYAAPLPRSICLPRTVCGTARCDVSLHSSLYGIKCDRKCKDHQPFCEKSGPATSDRRVVTSEWTHWQPVSDKDSSSVQQYKAECLGPKKETAFDCLGPGLLCCDSGGANCLCEVKLDGGHLRAYRYIVTPGSSTDREHGSIKARSTMLRGQPKVWSRFIDLASRDDISDSLFSNHKLQGSKNKQKSELKCDKQCVPYFGSRGEEQGDSQHKINNETLVQDNNVTGIREILQHDLDIPLLNQNSSSNTRLKPIKNQDLASIQQFNNSVKETVPNSSQLKLNEPTKAENINYHFTNRTDLTATENSTKENTDEKEPRLINLINFEENNLKSKNGSENIKAVQQTLKYDNNDNNNNDKGYQTLPIEKTNSNELKQNITATDYYKTDTKFKQSVNDSQGVLISSHQLKDTVKKVKGNENDANNSSSNFNSTELNNILIEDSRQKLEGVKESSPTNQSFILDENEKSIPKASLENKLVENRPSANQSIISTTLDYGSTSATTNSNPTKVDNAKQNIDEILMRNSSKLNIAGTLVKTEKVELLDILNNQSQDLNKETTKAPIPSGVANLKHTDSPSIYSTSKSNISFLSKDTSVMKVANTQTTQEPIESALEKIFNSKDELANQNDSAVLDPSPDSGSQHLNDEPEPVLKDIDMANVDDNLTDVLNTVAGFPHVRQKIHRWEKLREKNKMLRRGGKDNDEGDISKTVDTSKERINNQVHLHRGKAKNKMSRV